MEMMMVEEGYWGFYILDCFCGPVNLFIFIFCGVITCLQEQNLWQGYGQGLD